MKNKYSLLLKAILLLFLFLNSSKSFGQYNPTVFKEISFVEPSGTAQSNYQLMLELDTYTPILGNQMNSMGNDIRFSTSLCAPYNFLDYYIESGINTTSTLMWVRIPTIAASASQTIYLFYGDASATAASNFAATFPNVLITGGNNLTLTGTQHYDWIEVQADDTIFSVAGAPLTLQADRIKIDAAGSCVNGVRRGFQANGINTNGNGPGAGTTSTNSGSGGGSYAGIGGTGGKDAGDSPGTGGATYGTSNGSDVDMGSSGGSGTGISLGGAGGGAIKLEATLLSLNGIIDVSGGSAQSDGTGRGGGGGSGGSVYIQAIKVVGVGSVLANGGNGAAGTSTANDSGGGGGGGRIKFNSSYVPTLNTSVTGGFGGPNGTLAPGQPGGAGSTNFNPITYTAPSLSAIGNYTTSSGTSDTACDTYTWSANGMTYTASGTYTATSTNAAGCTHTDTLVLTINTSTSNTTNIVACNSYIWPINGITYTVSGTYTHTVTCHNDTLVLNLGQGEAKLSAKVLLDGPYDQFTGWMHDSLRVKNLIPTTEPFSAAPYNKTPIGEPGGEQVSASVLAVSGSNAIVDWIFLEVRNASNPATIIANKRALVQRDGDIVSNVDGISPVTFQSLVNGNYYVSVKHRNHLGVMSMNPIAINGCATSSIDFTNGNVYINPTISNTPRKLVGTIYTLWSADNNTNKNVKYNGLSNDKDPVLNVLGGPAFLNATLPNTYRSEDANMDGKVRFNNSDNDRLTILNNVGVNTPNNVINQHTPN